MQATKLVCFSCKHFRDNKGGGCDAFPNGIPPIIAGGRNKHKSPLKNQDNNIVYEKKSP